MKVVTGPPRDWGLAERERAVTVGVYDGLHAGHRAVLALLGAVAVLLGIAAAAHNFVTGQIGWNTFFTIAQTVVAAALMVIVMQDAQDGQDRQASGEKV